MAEVQIKCRNTVQPRASHSNVMNAIFQAKPIRCCNLERVWGSYLKTRSKHFISINFACFWLKSILRFDFAIQFFISLEDGIYKKKNHVKGIAAICFSVWFYLIWPKNNSLKLVIQIRIIISFAIYHVMTDRNCELTIHVTVSSKHECNLLLHSLFVFVCGCLYLLRKCRLSTGELEWIFSTF